MGDIVEIQLKRLSTLLKDRDITLRLTDKGKEWLARDGYDPAYGARPLKRVIQRHVQDPLAEQILEEGRLTDSFGRHVDFRNTIIILTSNIGAEFLVNQKEGEDTDAVRDQVMAVVRASFRPEFLNRVDEIILFHRLQKNEMSKIVDIQMARLARLLEDRKIVLDLEPAARDWLAEKGWDPAYGARPLKRVIQRYVQDPLAEMILAGEVKDGDRVKIGVAYDGLTFNGKSAGPANDDAFEGRSTVKAAAGGRRTKH